MTILKKFNYDNIAEYAHLIKGMSPNKSEQ